MHFQGMWQVGANVVQLAAAPSWKGNSLGDLEVIAELVAWSPDDQTGQVYIRGNKGVRITSGAPNAPKVVHENIAGIEIQAGSASQNIKVSRGMNQNEKIFLSDGVIAISSDADQGVINIDAVQQLSISVAGGTTSIFMDKSGIRLTGPKIDIN